MLQRNLIKFKPTTNIIITSYCDLFNHGVVTFSSFPVWKSKEIETITWIDTKQKFYVPKKYKIINNQMHSYFLFKDIYDISISSKGFNDKYLLLFDVKHVLLPVCIYEEKNKWRVNQKKIWWENFLSQIKK